MIYLATDHAGFELKNKIATHLEKSKIKYTDIGALEYDSEDDYPDFIIKAAEEVAKDLNNNLGIILGGSGQGEAIAANKVRGIRAAVYYGGPEELVLLSKTHNKANILSLGARFMSNEEAVKAVDLWLEAKFIDEERHQRRIDKITDFENI